MKKITMILLVALLGIASQHKAKAQADEIAQLLLNVEKLAQYKQILSDLKKGYDILNGGYQSIKDLSEGNFSIHKTFLDGLMQVSPAVRKYYKVGEIIDYQVRLVKEYKAAQDKYIRSGLFTVSELNYIGKIYSNLFDNSLRNLDELTLVITANKLRMNDDERLASIDRIHAESSDMLQFLRHFNGSTTLLGAQRQNEKQDISTMDNIHGIK